MKLEDEAEQFRYAKQKQFFGNIVGDIFRIEAMILKHLHDTKEREHAMTKLSEAYMWIKKSADTHGLR
jgi:hypothetical protein